MIWSNFKSLYQSTICTPTNGKSKRSDYRTKATSDAVSNQPKDLALHQQLGGVLIEVADRKSLVEVLDNDVKTLSEHLTRLQSRETDLMNSYEELKKVLEGSN